MGAGKTKKLTRDELAKEIGDLCDCVTYEEKIEGGKEAIDLVLAWHLTKSE